MVLSEAEAEARLAVLRRRREAIEREIRDLTLFLELGRRLGAGEAESGAAGSSEAAHGGAEPKGGGVRDAAARAEVPAAESLGAGSLGAPETAAPAPPRPAAGTVEEATQALRAALRAHSAEHDPAGGPAASAGPPPAQPSSATPPAEGAVSEGAQARRHGRALIAQTLAVLEQARRPLHASEILAALQARGFSVPGHDPVAALNTRLWKRAGPDGVLRRLGDAVYALPEAGADEA